MPKTASNSAFPKSARLRTSKEFRQVTQFGEKRLGTFLVIHYFQEESVPGVKLGLTVSRRFGKAHERNRFKRMIREVFRHNASRLPKNTQLNIRPRSPAKEASAGVIHREFLALLFKN